MATEIRSSVTDIPRIAGEKDKFGIEPFEKGLVRFIESTSTPITIALQGEWGSGKTSLMNTLRESVGGENGTYHSVWLNTWEYALMKDSRSTLFDIVSGLIQEVSIIADLDKGTTQKMINKVWSISKSALKFATTSALNKVADGAGDLAEGYLTSEGKATIKEIRDELEEAIAKSIEKSNKQGYIFFIDDLDRIDPPAAVELLELLKNIFTLKNCVFVLAIDYDVVIKGLEPKFGKLNESNEREFRSFFDKIIQVPFSMPVANYKIDDFVRESLLNTNYLSAEHANNDELIGKFSEISNLTVGTNPRALKRLMNSLSLIRCINAARDNSEENDQLNSELELLVNYALVSIQIAYPAVYKLLTLHSGFDKWNESVALQMNLKELDEFSKQKLSKSEEFDEEWEQVLFRLCENDHYLKKKALNISRLLNSLKLAIQENDENVEDIIDSVISLSSVTNLEAFDKPAVDYHRGNLLKGIRNRIIPKLKERLPEVASKIKQQGSRVQSNLFIKFTDNNWGDWVQFHSHPYEGGIRLITKTECWVSPTKMDDLKSCLKDAGKLDEFEAIEAEYNQFIHEFPSFTALNLCDQISKPEGFFSLGLYTYLVKPNTEQFYTEETLNELADVVAKLYYFRQKLNPFYQIMIDHFKT